MNQEEKAAFDQALALFRDTIPIAWYSMYQGCRQAGFTKAESMSLLKTYILGFASNGINPPPTEQGEK